MPRIVNTAAAGVAALALAGLATFVGTATAGADPTPGYPGGYPGTGYGGGGTPGGIDTTNPVAGGTVTVTASCGTGAAAQLDFDGTSIATAPLSNGTAVLTGTVPAGSTGAHTVVATCDSGQTYSFAVTVQSAGSGAGSSGGGLASTGAQIGVASGVGVVLVAGGVGLVLLARRHQRATP